MSDNAKPERAKVTRQSRRARAREHELALAGIGKDGKFDPAIAEAARKAEERAAATVRAANPRRSFVVGVVGAAVGGWATLTIGLLSQEPFWWQRTAVLGVAVVALMSGLRNMVRCAYAMSAKGLLGGCLAVAAVWGLFLVGYHNQVVVDGTPVPETSEKAAQVRLAGRLEDDLAAMAELDRLLALSANESRVAIADIEDARDAFADIARAADRRGAGDANGSDWEVVAGRVRDTAVLGEIAADAKLTATLTPDASTIQVASTARAAFIQSWTTAGQQLQQVASERGVAVGAPLEVRE